MRVDTIVVDNFYNDPDNIRSFALKQNFDVIGNFPGRRTKPFFNDSMKVVIAKTLHHAGGIITEWFDKEYSGSFQFCTKEDKTWVHADQFNGWSGVCYLTPNAPSNSGTAFYKNKNGSHEYAGVNFDWKDESQWEVTDYIANKYNRLVLYRGNLFHAATNYFGDNLQNGRLFQVFFLNTEY